MTKKRAANSTLDSNPVTPSDINKAMEKMAKTMDIVENIQTIDATLKQYRIIAKALSSDLKGTDILSSVEFRAKNLAAAQSELSQDDTKTKERIILIHTPQGSMGIPIASSNPEAREYEVHAKYTQSIIHDFNPSESLLLIDTFTKILLSRREELITLLEDMDTLKLSVPKSLV